MAKKMKISFKGVDKEIRKGGRAAHVPEGDYLFKVVKHEVRKTKDGSGKYISWQVQCVTKKYKGKTIYHITSLKPDALWNLRNLIHACLGRNVAGKVVEFDPTSLYGKIFAGTTEDDVYEKEDGKEVVKSVLVDLRPKDELEDDDEDEDEEEEDDEEDDDEDEEDSEDEDEEDDEDEDEEDEEEDEDEEPAPRKKRSSSGKGSSGKSKKKSGSKKRKSSDDDEDEDEDLEDIDVDDI